GLGGRTAAHDRRAPARRRARAGSHDQAEQRRVRDRAQRPRSRGEASGARRRTAGAGERPSPESGPASALVAPRRAGAAGRSSGKRDGAARARDAGARPRPAARGAASGLERRTRVSRANPALTLATAAILPLRGAPPSRIIEHSPQGAPRRIPPSEVTRGGDGDGTFDPPS